MNLLKITTNLLSKWLIWMLTEFHKKIVFEIFEGFRTSFKKFGVKFLLKNLFKPLFGFQTRTDHFISIIVRIGHFFTILIISFVYPLLKLVYLVSLYLFPFIYLADLFKIVNFNIPTIFFGLYIFLNFTLFLLWREEANQTLKNKYKNLIGLDLDLILENIDEETNNFLKVVSQRNKVTEFELFFNLISKKTIQAVFDLIERDYNLTRIEYTGVDVNLREILTSSFKIAYDNNLEKVGLLQIFQVLLTNPNIQDLLKNNDLSFKKLEEACFYIYEKSTISSLVNKFTKESMLRIHSSMNRGMTGKVSPTTDMYTTDVTSKASSFASDFFIGRDEEYRNLIEILKSGRSPLLIGKSGTGKTALLNYFAIQMASQNVPDFLEDKRLVLLNTSLLISGDSKVSGHDPFKIFMTILNEIKDSSHIILVIDEVSKLVGVKSMNQDSSFDLFTMLSNIISKDNLQVITTTTSENYDKYISSDSSLYRVFHRINFLEQSEDEIMKILFSKIIKYEKKLNKKFTLKAIKESFELSNRIIHDYALPLKTISLLDEVSMKVASKSEKLITSEDIKETIKFRFGLDLTKIEGNERDNLENIEDEMHKSIIGQNLAVKSVANALKRARLDIRDTNGPIASFLFLGPTGVGKTELAKTTAKIFFGENSNFIRIDMSEYPDKKSIYRLLGSNNEGEYMPGLLTEPVKNNPFSLVLFDEIEKAHPEVLDIFLQLLDDGRLTDGRGKTVDFKNTIIICTSNVGNEFIQKKFTENAPYQEVLLNLKNDILPKKFRLEFINRFSKVISFLPLNEQEILDVTNLIISNIKKKLLDKNIKLNVDPDFIQVIAKNVYNPIYGARNVKNNIQEIINDFVTKHLLKGKSKDELFNLTVADIPTELIGIERNN